MEKLDVLHRQGLRLCLGAFKSSPKESLYVEANEPPLEFRRLDLAMRYALKIKANRDNPTYQSLYELDNSHLYEGVDSNFLPLGEFIKNNFRDAHIDVNKITQTVIPLYPVWQSDVIDVSFKLSTYDKKSTPPALFKSIFLSEVLPEYEDYVHIYTDGSKQDERAACSFSVYGRCMYSLRLSNDSSIFTAEIEAINRALRFIKMKDLKKVVIFCDSKSVLQCIDSQETRNPLMLNLLDELQWQISEPNNRIIKFCWLPSHVGIHGNEVADAGAKAALSIPVVGKNEIPYSDLTPKVKTYIRNKWKEHYRFCHENVRPIKLFSINPHIRPFYINGISRKDEVIIHRIRIGHTRLTHSYVMEGGHIDFPPRCHFCGNCPLTVRHLIIECRYFYFLRERYIGGARGMGDLFERFSLKHILEFLKRSNLYQQI